jgi:hypothetical protein
MTNISKLILRATSAAAFIAMAPAAFAAPAIDANIELDSTYNSGSQLKSTTLGQDKTGMTQGGRLELNVSQKAGTEYFVAGRATLLAKKDGSAGTDDLWVQLGSATADIKLGRFEGADLFPIAQDTVVNHAGNVYGTNSLRGRSEKFHAAASFKLSSALGFELGLIDATDNGLGATGVKGARPVLTYAADALSVKLGAEVGKYLSGRNVDGMGATVGYSANGMGLNLNFAQGKSDAAADNKMTSMAINGKIGAFAAGLVSAKNEQVGGDFQIQTVHASYSIPLFGVAGASVTPAISHSTIKDSVAGTSQDVDAFRVRLNYAF